MGSRQKVERRAAKHGFHVEADYSCGYDINVDAPAGRVFCKTGQHGFHGFYYTPPVSELWDDALEAIGDGTHEPCPDFEMPVHIDLDWYEADTDHGCGECRDCVTDEVALGFEATARACRKVGA